MANSVTDLRVTGTVCAFCVSVQLMSFSQPNLMNWYESQMLRFFISPVKIDGLVKREIKLFFLEEKVQLFICEMPEQGKCI